MTPIKIKGITNGYEVDGRVWRGAQPEATAWPLLAAAGCKLVVDLNNAGPEIQEQGDLVESAGMAYVALDWSGIVPPRQKNVDLALAAIDGGPAPVFIHCLHGSDRTGTLCACWRIHHDGWNFDDAMAEAFTDLGLQGMHEFWFAAAVAEYATNKRQGGTK